jgi:hypothetical protein
MSKTGECWSTLLDLLHCQTDPEPFKLSAFIPMPKQYNFMLWWNTFSNHFNLFHHTIVFLSFQSTEKRFISWRHIRDDLFVSRPSSCYSSDLLKFRHSFHINFITNTSWTGTKLTNQKLMIQYFQIQNTMLFWDNIRSI